MSSPPITPPPTRAGRPFRRLIEITVLFLCLLLLFRTVGSEPFEVPTASMAPALLGHHKCATCPRCSFPVRVGYHPDEPSDSCYYTRAFCPNCDCTNLHMEDATVCRGDHLLVNKSIYDWSNPARWEMAVFRCPVERGKIYVKRIVGLPGETVGIRDGDIAINHALCRKSISQLKAVRILLYDHNFQPDAGWGPRWETASATTPVLLEGNSLLLGKTDDDQRHWLNYRHWDLDSDKEIVFLDEYSYNGGSGRGRSQVHDFMVECDVLVTGGSGQLYVSLRDGSEELFVELPVGAVGDGTRLSTGLLRENQEENGSVLRRNPEFVLQTGEKYHLEFAFVDRRATLTVGGKEPFAPLDRPAEGGVREGVSRPLSFGVRGIEVRISNVKLFRDIHYTNHGKHAVGTGDFPEVSLGGSEYFVLGDNSPNSEDNRAWDAEGRPVPVPRSYLLGKPFLVHMPSRIVHKNWYGRPGNYQTLDWQRIRRLR